MDAGEKKAEESPSTIASKLGSFFSKDKDKEKDKEKEKEKEKEAAAAAAAAAAKEKAEKEGAPPAREVSMAERMKQRFFKDKESKDEAQPAAAAASPPPPPPAAGAAGTAGAATPAAGGRIQRLLKDAQEVSPTVRLQKVEASLTQALDTPLSSLFTRSPPRKDDDCSADPAELPMDRPGVAAVSATPVVQAKAPERMQRIESVVSSFFETSNDRIEALREVVLERDARIAELEHTARQVEGLKAAVATGDKEVARLRSRERALIAKQEKMAAKLADAREKIAQLERQAVSRTCSPADRSAPPSPGPAAPLQEMAVTEGEAPEDVVLRHAVAAAPVIVHEPPRPAGPAMVVIEEVPAAAKKQPAAEQHQQAKDAAGTGRQSQQLEDASAKLEHALSENRRLRRALEAVAEHVAGKDETIAQLTTDRDELFQEVINLRATSQSQSRDIERLAEVVSATKAEVTQLFQWESKARQAAERSSALLLDTPMEVNDQLHKRFPEIPLTERLLHRFACSQDSMPGLIYVTEKNICWQGPYSRTVVPMACLTAVDKVRLSVAMPAVEGFYFDLVCTSSEHPRLRFHSSWWVAILLCVLQQAHSSGCNVRTLRQGRDSTDFSSGAVSQERDPEEDQWRSYEP